MSTSARIIIRTATALWAFDKWHDGYPDHTMTTLQAFLEDVQKNGPPADPTEAASRLNQADNPRKDRDHRDDIQWDHTEPTTAATAIAGNGAEYQYLVDLTDPGQEIFYRKGIAARFWIRSTNETRRKEEEARKEAETRAEIAEAEWGKATEERDAEKKARQDLMAKAMKAIADQEKTIRERNQAREEASREKEWRKTVEAELATARQAHAAATKAGADLLRQAQDQRDEARRDRDHYRKELINALEDYRRAAAERNKHEDDQTPPAQAEIDQALVEGDEARYTRRASDGHQGHPDDPTMPGWMK